MIYVVVTSIYKVYVTVGFFLISPGHCSISELISVYYEYYIIYIYHHKSYYRYTKQTMIKNVLLKQY